MPDIGKPQKDLVFSVFFRHYSACLCTGLWLKWLVALCFCYVFRIAGMDTTPMSFCEKYRKQISDCPRNRVDLRAKNRLLPAIAQNMTTGF